MLNNLAQKWEWKEKKDGTYIVKLFCDIYSVHYIQMYCGINIFESWIYINWYTTYDCAYNSKNPN